MKVFILTYRYSYIIHIVGFLMLIAVNFLVGVDAAYQHNIAESVRMDKLSQLSFNELSEIKSHESL
jgi:hypothetical protein